MKNGNSSPQLRKRAFDPETQEVTEVLPTETGQYLEEVRRATRAHLMLLNVIDEKKRPEEDSYYEYIGGAHPYRDAAYIKIDPLHPHESWFRKF